MDVQDAINAGYASGLIYDYQGNADAQIDQIRSFDGDAVLFSDTYLICSWADRIILNLKM